MTGALFVVTVPQKNYEDILKKTNKTTNLVEREKYENGSKLIHELKENKRSGSKSIDSYAQDDQSNVVISKCKSTDCLHPDNKNGSKNEVNLSEVDLQSDLKSYVKTSWKEIKQAIKPTKSKLKITRVGCAMDILGVFHWNTPLETILLEIIRRLDIKNAAWNATRDNEYWQVTFSLDSGNLCEDLLQVFRTFGIGTRHQSSVSVLPCALYYKSANAEQPTTFNEKDEFKSDSKTAWSRFSSSVRARNNLAQVLNDVRTDATLTFDWLFLLVVAAFVAAIGLVENSTVILVASMLISPLMGPITAATLGTAVRDRSLQYMGVIHELLGLLLCLLIGFIVGLAIGAVDVRYEVMDEWPTFEMISRCELRSLGVGLLVAIPSGAGVALAVLSEYTASLVGVAISASLLPPAVNAGLFWAMALIRLIIPDEAHWTVVQPSELAVLGTASLCLTLVNIVCIFLAGVAVYKIKEVFPLERRDISWWRANRNILQASKRNQRSGVESAWNIYNKRCNDPEAMPEEKKECAPGLIQSDTVTYRRHTPGFERLRAKNIEAYCLQMAQYSDSNTPLELDIHTRADKIKNVKGRQEDVDKTSEILQCDYKTENESNKSEDSNYSFYNLAFQNERDRNGTPRPILEPSLSFTVDRKNYGVILGSKSFNV